MPPAPRPTRSEPVRRQIDSERSESPFDRLSILEDIAEFASSDSGLDAVIEQIVDKCAEGLQAEHAALHLIDEPTGGGLGRTVMRKGPATHEGIDPVAVGPIAGWVAKHGRSLLVNDLQNDPRFRTYAIDERIHSVLSVPLRWKGSLAALLTVINAHGRSFTSADEQLLRVIATHSAYVLHAARLIGDLETKSAQLVKRNSRLATQVRGAFSASNIIGSSERIQDVLRLIDRISGVDVDVLITGESGTGKELIAKTIHYTSIRSEGPFVALNCAALPDSLLEAELFGVEKGVATGVEKREGHFEAASGGAIFLDEIGDLSLEAQAKILRVLQERVVQRVGGRRTIPIDVRVIAATNKNLEGEIREGRFREDLLYRLNVIRFNPPSLREIPGDIEALAQAFLTEACRSIHRERPTFTAEALTALARAEWPGNVRQLQNEMKRLAICVVGDPIEVEDLADECRPASGGQHTASHDDGEVLASRMAEFESKLVNDALEAHGRNQVKTAQALGLSRQGLAKKMKRLGISP